MQVFVDFQPLDGESRKENLVSFFQDISREEVLSTYPKFAEKVEQMKETITIHTGETLFIICSTKIEQ